MIRRSLRLRLILAFLAMVLLMLFVGLASYVIHEQVVVQVDDVRRGASYDLATHDAHRVGLEIKGYWNPDGAFVAEDIEPKVPQDPRLRGPLQGIDESQGILRLYGVDVHVTPKTRNGDDEAQPVRLSGLHKGQRVEVKCEVKDEVWYATKLYTRDFSPSDKVWGMVTGRELDGKPPEKIFIHGLEIVVEPSRRSSPQSALARMEQATRMIVEIQSIVSAAHALADRAPEGHSQGARMQAAERLAQCNGRFSELVYQGYGEGGDPSFAPLDNYKTYLDELTRLQNTQDGFVSELTRLASAPGGAERIYEIVHEHLDPFVTDRLMPKLTAYLWEGDEELGDQLRSWLQRAELTPRLALTVSFIAAGLAVALGWLVWRSIHRPLQQVHDAAVRLGQGHLDTRIQLRSRDEIGVLAEAFNTMAGKLSSTTVSMASLESVFDSMAAALIVFDADGCITSVNRATCDLLGRSRAELLGRSFGVVCRFEPGEPVRPIVTVGAAADGVDGVQSVERVFLREDGSELPVALSGAELHRGAGPVQGYVCVAQDLTEQKRIQQTIRESLAEKELLLREVHHRVKNNMQVITSLLAMQADDGEPEVVRRLQESQNRIRTIALIHEQLYLSAELAHIDLRSYLAVLTEHLLQSFGAHERVALTLRVEDLDLDVDQSLSIGLIVNELMTNSLKYAFPEGRRGTMRIELFANDDGTKTLLVADDGPGFAPTERKGAPTLGTSLVRTLSRQLKGAVEVDGSRGTTTRIVFGRQARPGARDRTAVTS